MMLEPDGILKIARTVRIGGEGLTRHRDVTGDRHFGKVRVSTTSDSDLGARDGC